MTLAFGAGAGSSIERLPAELGRLAELGYTAAELNPDYLDVIFGGRLHERRAAEVVAACRPYAVLPGEAVRPGHLTFTVHAPAVLDLRNATHPDVHLEILRSTVRLAAGIGARLVVVHYEQRSPTARVEAQFRRGVEVVAALAARHGITLGVENIEVERADCVLDFLDAVRLPNVRLTYDFGHNYLAARHFGYDFLASTRRCAPFAVHAHLSDNFGRFDAARLGDFTLYKAIPPRNLNIAGLGDVHLPLGWGALPYRAAVQAFAAGREAPFDGVLLGEHRRVFASADAEVLDHLRTFGAALAGREER